MLSFIIDYFQSTDLLFCLELLIRIIIAGLCGFIVGFERKNRGKGAGVRTHTIVAIAACLLMIISQYGFNDFVNRYSGVMDTRVDPSRIAAQIVSGIGFLGAGTIFIQKHAVTGLTTAAGIWATAGIGMSIGSGMYFLSIATTFIIVLVQVLLHKNLKFLHTHAEMEFWLTLSDSEASLPCAIEILQQYDISVSSVEFKRKLSDNSIEVYIIGVCNHEIDKAQVAVCLHKEEKILAVKF